MKRILDSQPRTGSRAARAALGAALLLLGGIGLAASGLSVHALAAETRGGDLAPFVGTWKGGINTMAAIKLEVRPDGTIQEHLYSYDGSRPTHVEERILPAIRYEVRGRTLSYTTRIHVDKSRVDNPRDSWPRGIIDTESLLELQSQDEAVLSVQPNSFFKHLKDEGIGVPPPPPPTPMKRQS